MAREGGFHLSGSPPQPQQPPSRATVILGATRSVKNYCVVPGLVFIREFGVIFGRTQGATCASQTDCFASKGHVSKREDGASFVMMPRCFSSKESKSVEGWFVRTSS